MSRTEELAVLTKIYDLILWSCHHTSRFLRNHRFVLRERIGSNLYDLLETLIQAKYTRERKPLSVLPYVEQNPVRAELVSRAETWRRGSL
jgi:hypothetical protein